MKNKKVRNRVLVTCIVLLVVLLSLGIFLFIQYKKQPVSNSNEGDTESMLIIQDDDSKVLWEKEDFKDETTDQKEPTSATQMGGSETLEIIPPKDMSQNNEESDSTEVQWLDGIW